MQQYLFSILLAIGFAFVLLPEQATAAAMRWTLKAKNSPVISLQENVPDGKVLYFQFPGATSPGKAKRQIDWTKTSLLGESGPVSLRVGLQKAGTGNLVLKKGPRRGLSMRIGNDSTAARLTAFVVQKRQSAETPYGLGLNQAGNRIAGVSLSLVPWAGGLFPLQTTSFVIVDPRGGSAWSFAPQTLLLGRFHLAGEVAGNGGAAPGPGSVLALSGKLWTAAPLPFVPVTYRLCLDWQRVGARYSSPGIPWLQRNRERTGGRVELSWQTLALSADIHREWGNVDSLAEAPQTETWQTSLSLTESLATLLRGLPLPFFLANPRWRFFQRSSWRRKTLGENPDSEEGSEKTYGVTLQGGRAPLAWKCVWQLSNREDLLVGERQASQFTMKAFLGRAGLQFSPFIRLSSSNDSEVGESSETATGFAGTFHPHAPWEGNLTFALRHRDSPLTQDDSLQVRGEVGWAGAKFAARPGIEISLDGSYQTSVIGNAPPNQGCEEGKVLLSFKIPLSS